MSQRISNKKSVPALAVSIITRWGERKSIDVIHQYHNCHKETVGWGLLLLPDCDCCLIQLQSHSQRPASSVIIRSALLGLITYHWAVDCHLQVTRIRQGPRQAQLEDKQSVSGVVSVPVQWVTMEGPLSKKFPALHWPITQGDSSLTNHTEWQKLIPG